MSPTLLAWIEQQKPDRVASAEAYVRDSHIYEAGPRGRGPRISPSQLRNLLNAAQGESPLAVIVNLLHYQMGRSEGWKDWPSGEKLEALLREKVGGAAESAPVGDKAQRYGVEARLATLLLGYVVREYVYQCKRAGTSL